MNRRGEEQAALIPIIQDIQNEYRYLPPQYEKKYDITGSAAKWPLAEQEGFYGIFA